MSDFSGIPFGRDQPYTYEDGRDTLKRLMAAIRSSELAKAVPIASGSSGRSRISCGPDQRVWDYLSLANYRELSHTESPHLSMILEVDAARVQVTLPNDAKEVWQQFASDGGAALRAMLHDAELATRSLHKDWEGARTEAYGLQRHWIRRDPTGETEDARLVFNLKTLVSADSGKTIATPDWAACLESLARNKSKLINLEIGIGVRFPYGVPIAKHAGCVEHFIRAWVALIPILRHIKPS